ncbi:hypothetical protein [Nocardiopsis sp. CNT-189]|uniref:hypothetical protein n=1 Tax=Nocardiopsis oceanisediminis TaxID=2816862 RepID=UPI003B3B8616
MIHREPDRGPRRAGDLPDDRPHFHGYLWQGSGEERYRGTPETYPDHPAFPSSPLPPQRMCWWLRKPASAVRGTWDGADGALAWLTGEYRKVLPQLRTDWPELMAPEARKPFWRDSLEQGTDVVCGHWLRGGNAFSATLVCCPNRWEGNLCPTSGRQSPAAGRG